MDGAAVKDPQTVASAIRIGNPASWTSAIKASQDSNGRIDKVSDEEILKAYRKLAADEGVFCEPASAASVAGLLKRVRSGEYFEKKSNEIEPVFMDEYEAKIESVEEALLL